jgi:hypothetical protein
MFSSLIRASLSAAYRFHRSTSHPSFRRMLACERRIGRQFSVRTDRPFAWLYEDKLVGRAVAKAVGVRVPERYLGPCPVGGVAFDSLPDEYVVKPRTWSGTAGVFPVRRRGDQLIDLLRGRVTSEHEIIAALESEEVFVEELISDPAGKIANDWKFYTFQGEIGLVLGVDRNPPRGPRRKYFDPTFRSLGKVRYDMALDQSVPPPQYSQALTDAAKLLSKAVPMSFVRVDLYESERGVTFGELSPYPGGPHVLRRSVDRQLGELWERSEEYVRFKNSYYE